MIWRGYFLWQALLVSTILRSSKSASTIQREAEREICVDFVCTRHSLKAETKTFVEDIQNEDNKQLECKKCQHCTDSGYSVCLKATESDGKCLCSQEIPRRCAISPKDAFKLAPEQQQIDICYVSSLRNPPKPMITVDEPNSDLIVTIDQFWLKNYYRHMKLENLTLFYEFPVHSPHLCDGLITTASRQQSGENTGYLCTPMLKIELEEEPNDSRENSDGGSTSPDDYDNNLPPEIQFERTVFDEASYVRFYYKIQVRRERQLNQRGEIVEKLTTLTSDVLTYNLSGKQRAPPTEVYKIATTTSQTTTQKASMPVPSINRVNIEHRPQQKSERKQGGSQTNLSGQDTDKNKKNHKSSFLNEHFTSVGQLQLIVCVSFITLGVCLILIVATLLYRRHIGSNKRGINKTPATTKMNGFEYRATVQDEQ